MNLLMVMIIRLTVLLLLMLTLMAMPDLLLKTTLLLTTLIRTDFGATLTTGATARGTRLTGADHGSWAPAQNRGGRHIALCIGIHAKRNLDAATQRGRTRQG